MTDLIERAKAVREALAFTDLLDSELDLTNEVIDALIAEVRRLRAAIASAAIDAMPQHACELTEADVATIHAALALRRAAIGRSLRRTSVPDMALAEYTHLAQLIEVFTGPATVVAFVPVEGK